MRVIKSIGWTFAWLVAFVCTTWAFGALHFDFPKAGTFVAIVFLLALLAAVIFVRGKLLKLVIVFGAFAVVLASHCQLSICGCAPTLLFHRNAQDHRRNIFRHTWFLSAVHAYLCGRR